MCRGAHGANSDNDRDTDLVMGCCCCCCSRFFLLLLAFEAVDLSVVAVPAPVNEDDRAELSSSRERARRECSTYGCGMAPTVVACK